MKELKDFLFSVGTRGTVKVIFIRQFVKALIKILNPEIYRRE